MRRVSYQYAGRTTRRRDRRLELPLLKVEVGGLVFDCVDWSMGGLCLNGIHPHLTPEAEVPMTFSGLRSGVRRSGRTLARVVRIDRRKNQTAFEFVGLPDDAFAALEGLITGLDH